MHGVAVVEFPGIGEHRIDQTQATMLLQLLRSRWSAVLPEVAGRGADEVEHRAEILRDQLGIRQLA
ncbi:hypothetical protein D3C77_798420 [compost metagenome]